MLIDSHCHLNYFTKVELPEILANAYNNNVEIIQTICTRLDEVDYLKALADKNTNIYCSIGVHPNEAINYQDTTSKQLIKLANHPKVISLGETGLDYYYEKSSPSVQKQLFSEHIEAARELNLPIVIHSRAADEDMINILKAQMKLGSFGGVLHSFTSSSALCNVALELGFYISFSGIVTFKNAIELQNIAKTIPSNRILIETDAPYLSPVPKRGKRNEPAFLKYTLDFLSNLRNETNLEQITTENFFELFKKVPNFKKNSPLK